MGQKINPIGLRVGISRDWEAKWYAEKDFGTLLNEDLKVRSFIEKRLADASVSKVEIERAANRVNVSIHTAKPGMVIGKGGSEVENLRKQLNNLTGKRVHINIVEIKQPDLDAELVGESIAQQLEARVAFRRAMKQAIQRTMRAGAHGIKTMVSGRLNGADIARKEMYSDGTVPLHTLRADIDYSWDEAVTTYGKLGVKTWIYRGDILPGETHGDSIRDNIPAQNNRNSRGRGGNRGNNNRGGNRNNNRNNGAKGGN
ncbi:30S ribosomal protein S3 [Loigolactobacillus binensis]|uniref:Small ribosomal subunit protein uS3 n=1 Tax=Loigolactobacillus binensis TaxID=2559922 RepID=A0ABW3EG02_9LACO|nr:30S ribosomal protein S3 [Loigolactobacillus binensis]